MSFPPLPNGRPHASLNKASPAPTASPATETPPISAPPDCASGRDAHGRFAQGNRGGPGNPFARRTAAFRRAFCEAISEKEVHVLARQLYEQALLGDGAAAKLVLAYLVGKPTTVADPDTLDVAEWQLYQRSAVAPGEVHSLLTQIPAGVLSVLLQTLWPLLGQHFCDQLYALLSAAPQPQATVSPDPTLPAAPPVAEPVVEMPSPPTPAVSPTPSVTHEERVSPRRAPMPKRRPRSAGSGAHLHNLPDHRQETAETVISPRTALTEDFDRPQGRRPVPMDQETGLCFTG
jgi:hypothetical protein